MDNSKYRAPGLFDQQVQPATEKPGAAALKMHYHGSTDIHELYSHVVRAANEAPLSD